MADEWVALETWGVEYADMFYEVGAVYTDEPICHWGTRARKLEPTEHVVPCPRCGLRFVATVSGSAESHRDLHFDGDKDCPSICRGLPTMRPRLVKGNKEPGT